MTKKRRHHYVWRYYLRPWTCNDKIWCQMNSTIFCPNLIGVAQRRDFYKLKESTLADIFFLNEFINKMDDFLKILNKPWIPLFNKVFELEKYLNSKNIFDQDLKTQLDELKHNLEENIHCKIEESGKPYLDDILQEDISFFKTDKGCMEFIYFLCVQFIRTEGQKYKTLDGLNALRNPFGVKFENIWNVLTHIIATNVGWNLYAQREKYHMVLLKNISSLEYLTSDQPVINTYAYGKQVENPEELDFYYPVSPNLAIYLTNRPEWKNSDKAELNESDVNRFNIYIVEKTHKQLFASNEESLLRYQGCLNN